MSDTPELVERVAGAIDPTPFQAFYESTEWARVRRDDARQKARAAIEAMRKRMQEAEDAGTDIVDAWHYLRDEIAAALEPRR